MKKKIFAVLGVTFAMSCLFAFSCSSSAEDDDADTLKIAATLFPQYDFAKAVVGDKGEVELILPPGTDSHSFDPSMQDILKMSDSDLFIYTGEGMEIWSDAFAANVGDDCMILNVSEGIELCGVSEHGHTHVSEYGHDINVDPHIWTSPVNAAVMVENIYEAIVSLDPKNEAYYRANADTYLAQLSELDGKFRECAESFVGKKIYFGGEFAFLYLTEEYGINYVSLYESCTDHAEPDPKKLSEMIDEMNVSDAKVVFYPELFEPSSVSLLATETGAKPLQLHSCHNLTVEEMNTGRTYISVMYDNLENLKEALS